jgi:hypothetical protein
MSFSPISKGAGRLWEYELNRMLEELYGLGGGGATNLGYTAATRILTSDTGTDVTLPLADGDAGLMSAADKAKLDAISGTNTGDQTTIVGITGTKAEFDTAVSDGNIMYIGDAPTAHNHVWADLSDVTMTLANLLALDDGVSTALHFHDADRARANHTGTQLAATVSDLAATVQAYTLDLFADPVAPMNFAQQAITGFNIALGAPGAPVDGDIWRV